jgi:mRNA interferase HigB
VKEKYRNASLVGDNRVVFNIKGNSYRLVVIRALQGLKMPSDVD